MADEQVTTESAGERCARCGEIGEDRRSLWMACFYQMNELKLPLVERVLFHAKTEELTPAKEALKLPDSNIVLQSGTVRSSGELTPQILYTLRVCKGCRSDWMQAQQRWFAEKQEPQTLDEGDACPCGGTLYLGRLVGAMVLRCDGCETVRCLPRPRSEAEQP